VRRDGCSSEVVNSRPVLAAEWDAAWQACPYATYFQSRARAEDWAAYTAGTMRPEPLDPERAAALLAQMGRPRAPVWWRVDPFDPSAATVAAEASQEDVTHVLQLQGGRSRPANGRHTGTRVRSERPSEAAYR